MGVASEASPDQALSRPAIMLAGAIVGAAFIWISPLLSIDYWDRGFVGLAVSMAIGFTVLSIRQWHANSPQPLATAFVAVGPWAFGLGGMAYVGFGLLVLEVLATALLLGFLNRSSGLSMPRAVLVALVARAASLLPLAF